MPAIDICDSDEEDAALARKREAIRRRREQAEAEHAEAAAQEPEKEKEEPKVKFSAPRGGARRFPAELPVGPGRVTTGCEAPVLPEGPWTCPFCEESNGEKRLKCNNCTKPRPGTEEVAAAAPAPPPSARRKRKGWDDWDEQAKKAAAKASAANACLMKDVVNRWKPTVEQLNAMTVAELGPICKTWKISIEPKEYMRDVMLSKALKVIHGVES
ncbi:unnamed protein product [Effrenium voratum]|uniref:RanBP2-type domain-containing protein n=1 Tax=Effrenium voratum TaxID=2562239 RepID=A0AA36MHL7_9DINO|nr:unnamed protein product [Effrenium voratum]